MKQSSGDKSPPGNHATDSAFKSLFFRNAREVLKDSRVINKAEVLASQEAGFVECHVFPIA